MTASPTASVRNFIAGLAALAVVAVGCTAEPDAVDAGESPTSAPVIDQPDDLSPDDVDDDASGDPRPSTPVSQPVPTEPVTQPVAKPAPQPVAGPTGTPAAVADGDHAGRLISITTTDVTVNMVRILTGEEAIAAARADGGAGLDDDGTLPNDIYIQDLRRVVTIPVAGDGGFRIYDCSAACEIVGTTLAALASGEVVPYGGPNAVINLTVDHGVIVSFEEQYLP